MKNNEIYILNISLFKIGLFLGVNHPFRDAVTARNVISIMKAFCCWYVAIMEQHQRIQEISFSLKFV